MADFNFFLNTQGLRGRAGTKGADGFAPVIAIGQNTLNTFTLLITTADGTFETPNLRGSIINNAGSGTFLRYDAETDSIYLSELPTASETEVGGVTIATDEELANAAGTGVVTADSMGVGIYGALKAGNNVSLSLDEETGLVTISAVGGGQGTSNYEELTNKPSLYGTEIVGDKKLSDFVEFKAPLKETIAVDYEKDVVIVNGNKTDDSLTLNTSWAPLFTDTSSASLPFDITGDVTLNGNEFTPSSGVEMPFKPGDIIGVPGDTGADIALGNIREDGQFVFTHLIRIDGLGVSYTDRAFMPVATKTNSSGTLKCTCDSTVTSELTTGQNFTDNIAYFQVRIENGKMIAVCLKSVGGVFSNGVKVTSSNSTTVANSEKLQRFSFGGVGSNVNPLNQFKLYRNTGLKLEECADQSAFNGLTNMVNWAFPDDTNNISVQVDNDTIKISETGQLAVTDKVIKNNELNNYIKAGKDIEIAKDELTNVLTIKNSAGAPFYKDLQGLPIFRNPLSKTSTVMAPLTGLSLSGDYVNVDTYTAWGTSISGTSATAVYNFSIKKTYLSSYDTTKKTLKPKSYVAIPYNFGQIFTYDTGMGNAKALLANQQEDGTFEILGAICQSGDNLWYIGSKTDGAWDNDPIAFYGYRGSPVYQETPLPNGTVNMYQGFVQLIDNGDTVKAVMEYCYPHSVSGEKRSQCYVRTIDNATEVQKAQKVTHILISGFPTNTNTWLKSSFGLYSSDGKTLASDIPINSLSSYPNLFNIEESNETININCKVDGQTVVVDKNGNLSVGDDVMLKEQLYPQLVAGSNIILTEDADTHKVTIASTGGGGGTITDLNAEYPLVYEQSQVGVDGNVINGTVASNIVTLDDTAYTISTSTLGIKSNTVESEVINGIEPTSCVFLDFNVEHAYLLPTTNRRPVIFGKKVGKKGIIPKYVVNTADNLAIYSVANTPTFDSASSTYRYAISAISPYSSGNFTAKYVMSYFGFHVSGTERIYQGITATTTSSTSPYANYGLTESDLVDVDTVCYFNDAGIAMDFNSKDYGELTVDIFSASSQDPSSSSNRIANTMVEHIEARNSALKLKYDSNTLGVNSNNELYSKTTGGEVDAYTKAETDGLLATKQDTLVSGTNIKTINGNSILGEGNLVVSGGTGGVEYADSNTVINSTVGSVILGPHTATSGISVDTSTGIATIPTSGTPQVSLDFTPVELAGHAFEIQAAFKVRASAPFNTYVSVLQEAASYANRTAPQIFIQANGNITFDIPNADGTGWLVGDVPSNVVVSGGDTVVAKLICDGTKITSSVSKNGLAPVEATIYDGAYVRLGTVKFMYGEGTGYGANFAATIEHIDLMNTYVKYDGEYIWQSTSDVKNALAVKVSTDENNAIVAKGNGLFVEKVDVTAINDSIAQLMSRIVALEAEINGGNA